MRPNMKLVIGKFFSGQLPPLLQERLLVTDHPDLIRPYTRRLFPWKRERNTCTAFASCMRKPGNKRATASVDDVMFPYS